MNDCPITDADHSKRNKAATVFQETGKEFSIGCKDCFCKTPWFNTLKEAQDHWDAYQPMSIKEYQNLPESK